MESLSNQQDTQTPNLSNTSIHVLFETNNPTSMTNTPQDSQLQQALSDGTNNSDSEEILELFTKGRHVGFTMMPDGSVMTTNRIGPFIPEAYFIDNHLRYLP